MMERKDKIILVGVAILSLIVAAFFGAMIDRARTGNDTEINLVSPLERLPDHNQVVYVRYRWGATHARFIRDGDGYGHDLWLEYNIMANNGPDSAAVDLGNMFGLPIWWGYDPEIPAGLIKELNEQGTGR